MDVPCYAEEGSYIIDGWEWTEVILFRSFFVSFYVEVLS